MNTSDQFEDIASFEKVMLTPDQPGYYLCSLYRHRIHQHLLWQKSPEMSNLVQYLMIFKQSSFSYRLCRLNHE